MMMMGGDMWARLGSTVAGLMFAWAMFQQYVPIHLRGYVEKYTHRLMGYFYPYIQISIHELTGERMKCSEAYTAIEAYLSSKSSERARRLKADIGKDSKSMVLSMDANEEITDEFKGIKLWWTLNTSIPKTQSFSFYPSADVKRYYTLTFHKLHRKLITETYLDYVLEEGKAVGLRNRQRKLFTNNRSDNWYGYKRSVWSHVVFEHPATFQTLAMDPEKKQEIVDDLVTFRKGKEYYAKVGKAWKRGYLLYGPPGTGKSTMIAAMANFLNYDIYDLELTAVKDNTELRKLLIETSSKSIIVIEDIDCSLDLTGQRKKTKEKDEEEEEKDPIRKREKEEKSSKESKVTLSGLLNFIDGLWSACGGERLIIFTTNYVEKLDPALIRRGRMDKHIKLSYCSFEGFKVLAKNYLDLNSHHLFGEICSLMEETEITPADVAENLMPKTITGDAETCLENLIRTLKMAKEEARLKAVEEMKEKETSAKTEVKEESLANGEAKDKETSPKEDAKDDESIKEE
ncbi:hypothetical protein HHK36_007171 [Tetracentron sinense]|uniref:AAA+ ATPase domain-containing protein n=1 Tax=Tetracentron sinense TaxID=13715 RepID=A0A835DLK3_TETSI|nr:hypothetical protein HHK36_007171 [Tetracentron sinense]